MIDGTIFDSIHPVIYKCDDFTLYLEEAHGVHLLHLKIHKFSHNAFRRGVEKIKRIQKTLDVPLYGYGEEESTYKMMKMAGFKETGSLVLTSTNNTRRVLCLQ